MNARGILNSTCLLVGLISFVLSSNASADGEEPFDPTSPEQVAEREEGKDAGKEPEEGFLSGPTVDPSNTVSNQGGGKPRGEIQGRMQQLDVFSIFSAKCQKCHGPDSQKGGIQLMPLEMVFSGSEKHWVVLKGDPANSELVRRIQLDAGHDDIMPPEGAPLSKAEIEVIVEWVKSGAPTDVRPTQGRQNRIQPRQWAQAYMQLELTQEQRTDAESLMKTYQEINGEYDRKNRTRLRELQAKIRETRDSNDTISNASMKQELERLQAERPKFETIQEQLWTMLTTEQQEQMREALENIASGAQEGMNSDRPRGRRPGDRGNREDLSEEERERIRERMKRRRNGQGAPSRPPVPGRDGDPGED